MSKEEWVEKTIERFEDLESEELENLKEEIESKLNYKKKPTEVTVMWSKLLECDTCNFCIVFPGKLKLIENQVIEAALKGSKKLEELKPFYDLEFLHTSNNPIRTYEKALLFAQNHAEKGHHIKYVDNLWYLSDNYIKKDNIITDRNGNRTREKI